MSDPQPWPFAESDRHGWPDTAACAGEEETFDKALCAALIDVRKKRTDQEIARAQAEIGAELAIEQEYYKGILEVAKGSIERARASASTVQTAAAAIGTIYTAIIGAAFAAGEAALPARALFPAVFLGLAILLSTAYLAYLPDPRDDPDPRLDPDSDPDLSTPQLLTDLFVRWTRSAVLRRSPWLRSSVIALGAAIVLLPAPFVTISAKSADDVQAAAATVPWPTPDPAAGSDAALRKIVYQAQVEEVVAQRKPPAATESTSDTIWWLLSGAAVLGILVVLARGSETHPPRNPVA
jgi:hypothetical protein